MVDLHCPFVDVETIAYDSYASSEVLIFGGHVKVREYLYAWVVIWIDTILSHIDTTPTILPKY